MWITYATINMFVTSFCHVKKKKKKKQKMIDFDCVYKCRFNSVFCLCFSYFLFFLPK